MREERKNRWIRRIVISVLVFDFLLALTIAKPGLHVEYCVSFLVGVLIAQFGVCCGAILRSPTLRVEAIGGMVLLASFSGAMPVVLNYLDAVGYVLVSVVIVSVICLATNLIPTMVMRWFVSYDGFQFSIFQMMLLMTLAGIGALIVSLTDVLILVAVPVAVLFVAPSAICCFLVGNFSKARIVYPVMGAIALIVCVVWISFPWTYAFSIYLLAQTLMVTLGAYVLLFIELERTDSAGFNPEATANPLRSEFAPDPLDEL